MDIIFMGTPEFAVPALQNLIQHKEHNVKAVFTRAPKTQGRGMKLCNSPVHDLALKYNIDVHTPKTLKNQQALDLINSIQADIIVVVAYGFIIPANILNAKKYGCLNIHPSRLPQYRGAAPLQRTIINGEKETSICIMQMDEGLDTGDIILQKNIDLSTKITLQELHDQCANIGGELLLKTLANIESLKRIKQSEHGVSYAEKLQKEEGKVDWHKSSYVIDCMVRGMNPWPGVYFQHDNKIIKIIEAESFDKEHKSVPGTILNIDFEVACGSGILKIKYLKPEGKQKMLATDYLRGVAKNIEANKVILS
ncbi:MAG: methionyl-tRNA formyltransferase [Rickettsiales bacterium]|nr:MAG: methionyl-tRNA formyltransferase [Rickettsiales bacterium]